MLIDTHSHLHDREFFSASEAEQIIARAHQNQVEKIICIGTDLDDSLAAQTFAESHENIYWTFGIHPENAKTTIQDFKLPHSPQLVAIGEVGLDYHSDDYDRPAQIDLLNRMLELAEKHDLPLSFHVREAFDDFFPIIANFRRLRGVVHSFTDNKKSLRRILNETDFYVGVNGLATYSTLPLPPLERILLETDAPFLTPIPYRGTINESGYIRDIAVWLSEKLQLNFEIIERETTKNAEQLFRFQSSFLR